MTEGGYHGRYLVINLTERSFQAETLPEELIAGDLGGRGMGTRLLFDRQRGKVDPLSPENHLMVFTGPVTGTNFPGSSRAMFVSKSPLSRAINPASMGGSFPNPWWDISQELGEKVRTAIAKAATGEFVRLRAQHRAQDGAIDEIDFSMTPIMDQSGKVIQIIPEGRRITALAKVQDELRQAKAELECRVQERTRELEQANAALLQQQEELRRQQQRLQDLTGKLLVAQESERRRIAQELHDDVTQRLAALTIDLRSLRLQGSPVIELNQLHDRAKQLTTDVQRMSHQLR